MGHFLLFVTVLLMVSAVESTPSTCDQECVDNEDCVDTTCECSSGFERIERTCKDVNECVDDNPCDTTVGACFNYPEGSYTCTCPNGYTMDPDTYICDDIDECETKCTNNGICTNSAGSFHCDCNAGYEELQKGTCTDIDECSTECLDDHEVCTNFDGDFNCTCLEGYERVDSDCIDVDECLKDPCDADLGTCSNTDGSFSCSCENGYRLDPIDNTTCIDINECSTNTDNCDSSVGICANEPGAYSCSCLEGYTLNGNGESCDDVNECAGDNKCDLDSNAICLNTPGSYSCDCPPGFRFESSCIDIDECEYPDFCQGGDCKNLLGTFNCSCNDSFVLDNQSGLCRSQRQTQDDDEKKPVGLIIGLVALALVLIACTLVVVALLILKKHKKFADLELCRKQNTASNATLDMHVSENNIYVKSEEPENFKQSEMGMAEQIPYGDSEFR